jgi:heavy metal translocating P-type ATPase
MTSDTLPSPVTGLPESTANREAVLLSTAEQRSLALRLTLSLAAAGCLIVWGGLQILRPDEQDLANLVAGLAALLVAGPALLAAWRSLRKPGLHGIMDQLIAIAMLSAWAAGDMTTAALLPLVMTIGHILEERSLLGSQEAIRALSKLTESKARRVLADGSVEEIFARDLRAGDKVQVLPGERVPADGTVDSGHSNVDAASITGESLPVEVAPGSEVLNGSMNLDGYLQVVITRVGSETTLGRVVSLLRDAELAKPPIMRLLERYANSYIILVLLLTLGAWFATGSTVIPLAVLIASCPSALILAAPATSIAAISVASRHGILVKGAAFLEGLATVDSIALDKTGTITYGHLTVIDLHPENSAERDEIISTAGALGATSNHPVSRALTAHAENHAVLEIVDPQEVRGLGVVAKDSEGNIVAMGREALFKEQGIDLPPPPAHDGPVVGVSRGSRFLGWVLLADQQRPEARAAMDDLTSLGLKDKMIITGDRKSAAERVAADVGITEVYAELLPAEKMERILAKVKGGFRPLVVGDGINDALALKAGAVGIAMGVKGTDVALASADLVLMTNDLRRLGTCIRLSRRCRRTIYTNVAIGLVWTVVMVALALGGVFGASGALIAALLQNSSSLVVMTNAGRLLKFDETLT